ncbi:unnamed protein product [Vitrella brassicaformis CCMP3155]|uniref:Uncharacterized protein n=2 Tax=Vitrella brassicaformis TaxID=1169539 RepID=A0A0G4H6A6_VITBC|nr:unnamed protein product [Vitrella brassicaformis CCMP3155]|mmetsp:Transcript_38963/g.97482  ORF Transcript_38963/g.97482 Transcript_38963/m.97482 type:complete len:243 (+) Transcript_38963:72-800(+)|eukprot:CEM39397.1 unnamed protein product [Vitrella brassicaformis CCMP3155]
MYLTEYDPFTIREPLEKALGERLTPLEAQRLADKLKNQGILSPHDPLFAQELKRARSQQHHYLDDFSSFGVETFGPTLPQRARSETTSPVTPSVVTPSAMRPIVIPRHERYSEDPASSPSTLVPSSDYVAQSHVDFGYINFPETEEMNIKVFGADEDPSVAAFLEFRKIVSLQSGHNLSMQALKTLREMLTDLGISSTRDPRFRDVMRCVQRRSLRGGETQYEPILREVFSVEPGDTPTAQW